MEIYNFSKFNKVFFCGGTYDDCGVIIKKLQDNMTNGVERPIHPKELERQERINKRKTNRLNGTNLSSKLWRPMGSGHFDNSVIFVSGGFGFGTKDDSFFEGLMGNINKLCEFNDSYVVFVRGNNDNPAYFNDGRFSFDRVKLAKDYTVVRLDGFDCLCVGGSLPIDRQWKIEHGKRIGKPLYFDGCKSEFKKEVLDDILDNFNISCIVTSDAPTFMPPSVNVSNSKWAKNDKTISSDLTAQRLVMDDIYREFLRKGKKPYLWCYTSNLLSDSIMCGDIKGVSSSSCSHFNLQDIALDTFGVGLNGEKMIRTKQYKKKTPRTNPENRLMPHPDFELLYGGAIAGNLEPVAPAIAQEGITAEQISDVIHRYNNVNVADMYQNIGIQATAVAAPTDITLDLTNDRQ